MKRLTLLRRLAFLRKERDGFPMLSLRPFGNTRVKLFAARFLILCGCLPVYSAAASTELLQPGGPIPAFDGGARHFLVTGRSDFAKQSFQAEITVTVASGHEGNGCAYFGMGSGEINHADYEQPDTAPSLMFRFQPNDFAGGTVGAYVNGHAAGPYATLGDGTHRLRLTWNAARKWAWLQVQPHWTPGSAFAPTISLRIVTDGADFSKVGRLFAGGASGVAFADFSVRPLSEMELNQLPVFEDYTSFPQDSSAGTWLPANGTPAPQSDAINSAMDPFLKDLDARMRPLVCFYNGSSLQVTRSLPGGKALLPNSQWSVAVNAAPVAGDSEGRDVTLTFACQAGNAQQAGVAAAFDFNAWSTSNYVMIPCSVYNGNRNRIVGGGYAEGLPKEDWYRKDMPLTTRQIPCLALDPNAPSKLEVLACNTGTPAICVLNRSTGRAFIVLSEQGIRVGDNILDNALCVEESPDRTRATLVIAAPGVRDRKPEFIGFSASPDRGIDWKPGQSITMRLRVYDFQANDIPGLYDKFMSVRKAVTGPNHPRDLYPMSEVERIMTSHIDNRYYDGKDFKFYCPENAVWISFGWIGGLMDTFPVLALGDAQRLERVSYTFDFAMPRGQGASGYFYGALDGHGKPFGREGYPDPNIALTRKNADVLYWMMKQFILLKAQGRAAAIKPQWESNVRRLADAFVRTWEKDGQWGNDLNVDTGEVVIYNSTSAAQAPGGLALAAKYYGDPQYLRVAMESANYYYKRDFLGWGATTGHSADTLQNADGDSPMAFAASMVAIYEVTGDRQWLEKARNILNLQSSWTTSFDYELPKTTVLGQLDAKLTGVIWASTQNKHAAPGHCTSASDPLLKVYRATGDVRYAELLRDIYHAYCEGIRPDGCITERLTYCDADSRGDRGGGSTGWTETNGAMMAIELPGIYLRTDTGRFYVFDSVKAEVLRCDSSGATLRITNPTKYDAAVSILAEDAGQSQRPLGYTAFLNWPKVSVKAGATATVRIHSSNGVAPVQPEILTE